MSGATCRSIGSPALAVTLPAWVILINGAGGTYDCIAIMCFYPKTEEGWEELGKRVVTAPYGRRWNCIRQSLIHTTKGTYKPKEHQKPGWQPSR